MAQLRLRDFFNVKSADREKKDTLDIQLADQPELDKADNISFHSFTVYKSFDGRDKTLASKANLAESTTAPLSESRNRPRKISGFDECMLDNEFFAPTPSNMADRSPVPELVNRPPVRMPFHQLQLKQNQVVKAKGPKLDEFFKSILIVDKDENLGKRDPAAKDDGDTLPPQKSNQLNRKVRPMDNFVVKIKRNTQTNCNLMRLDCETIKRIMKFLTLTDNARLSRVCNFLYHSFKGLWFNSDFFSEMDLSKFSGVEIRKIQQKSKLPHNQTVLGNLLKGKNLDIFLKRNRVAFASVPDKSSKKGVISKLEVSPMKPHNFAQNTLITDRDITKILQTSTKTLTFCNLVSCMFISAQTFKTVAQVRSLQWLCISNNQNLLDTHAIEIITNCTGLLHLNFSKCSKLTEATTDAIVDNLKYLESLDVSYNTPMVANFRNPSYLRNLSKLTDLDISFCGFSDAKLVSIVKNLPSLQHLNIEACSLLTIDSLSEVLLNKETSLNKIVLSKTAMERDSQVDLKKIQESKGSTVELIYHRQ